MLFVTCFGRVLQVVCGPHWIEVTKTHFAFTFKKLIRRLYEYSSSCTNRIASETLLSNLISYPVIYCKAVVEKVSCKLWLITSTNYWDGHILVEVCYFRLRFVLFCESPILSISTRLWITLQVRSKREDLLAHPLTTSLLRRKWHNMGRYLYYTNLLVYVVYLIFFTGFSLTIPSPIRV